MKRSVRQRHLWSAAMLAAVALSVSGSSPAAQTPPPVEGVHGTMAIEATMKTFYKGLNVIVVATIDGVEHTYHFTKDLIVHGGKGPDTLQGLQEGAMVVVHFSGSGSEPAAQEIDVISDNQGLRTTEGRVMRIDRGKKEITVRFGSEKTETFRLTERAAEEAKQDATAEGARVVIYYTDEGGQRVAHYFKSVK